MPPTNAPGGEKKVGNFFFVNFFLSPVAGQVVDVGASWPGGAALPRVDLAFDPIGKKSENFSKSRGRPSSRCRSVSGRPIALLRVDLAFDPIEKKVKIFLSPVAGQVVDVGASRAGGAALLRVDLGFGPIGDGCL